MPKRLASMRFTVIVCALAGALHAGEPPKRIVSANLCADRLVVALADPDKVISLSYHASDPLLSTVLDRAATLPLNHADAEEIAAMHPDLVVFGVYSSGPAATMLKGLGIPVYLLAVPNSLEEVRGTIRDLALRLGVPERGERLVAEIDAGLAGLNRHHGGARAVVYSAGGWTYGAHSIDDDIFAHLGAANIATLAGIDGIGNLSLEQLIAFDPRLIVIEAIGGNEPSLAAQLLEHPVLASGGARRLEMPMKLWQCQDSSLVEAARRIDEALP
jgi:iron complex transport system substrate-binding protein